MQRSVAAAMLALAFATAALGQTRVLRAASRFEPRVKWQAKSVVAGDFTCEARRQYAILGVDSNRRVVVAIFVSGLAVKPAVLEVSQDPDHARLEIEPLDYEPDYDLPGYRQSKTCKGLVVSDDEIDPTHLYWNREALVFGGWSN